MPRGDWLSFVNDTLKRLAERLEVSAQLLLFFSSQPCFQTPSQVVVILDKLV